MPLSTGQIIRNRYRITRLLAQGGLGAVYRGWDLFSNIPVIIKENPENSADAQLQFEREAKLLLGLNHPNIVKVAEYFFIPGQGQFLITDYIEGDDLDQKLHQKGSPFSESEALPWILQICDALSYLHAQNPPIIHQDIKPNNIKITPQGRAILVDFGTAKIYMADLKTAVGARFVTPGYSPPEQYGNRFTDARSDIYALGATFYTLLTAQEPPESVQRIRDDTLLSVRQINPSISTALDNVIARALSLDPAKRFQTVESFKNALESAVQRIVDSSSISCRRCGKPLRPGAKYCASCGEATPVNTSPATSKGPWLPVMPVQPAYAPPLPPAVSTDKSSPFLLSIAFPKQISKQWDSKFIVHLYTSNKRPFVLGTLNIEFIKEQINEILRKGNVDQGSNVRISLRSNDIAFEPEYVQKKVKKITRFDFLGRPNANCVIGINSERQVLLVISDAVTGQTYQSEFFKVRVVDLVFGFIPRPLISVVSTIIIGIGSIAMFVLTILGQIDNSLGLASGATAGLVASIIYASYSSNFGPRNVAKTP